jgi:hypothetical protein
VKKKEKGQRNGVLLFMIPRNSDIRLSICNTFFFSRVFWAQMRPKTRLAYVE